MIYAVAVLAVIVTAIIYTVHSIEKEFDRENDHDPH